MIFLNICHTSWRTKLPSASTSSLVQSLLHGRIRYTRPADCSVSCTLCLSQGNVDGSNAWCFQAGFKNQLVVCHLCLFPLAWDGSVPKRGCSVGLGPRGRQHGAELQPAQDRQEDEANLYWCYRPLPRIWNDWYWGRGVPLIFLG